jgi:hypothetical protein
MIIDIFVRYSQVTIIIAYIRRFASDEPSISLQILAVSTASAAIFGGRTLVIGLAAKQFEKGHILTP